MTGVQTCVFRSLFGSDLDRAYDDMVPDPIGSVRASKDVAVE